MATAIIAIADGTEEIEFSACHDVLVRAGFKVTVASVMEHKLCALSQGIRVEAEVLMNDVKEDEEFDVVVCPGGMPGATHLAANSRLITLLKNQKARGACYAAICASPAVVFHGKGITSQEQMVCYPSFAEALKKSGQLGSGQVAVYGKCITATGPGSAIAFALAIVDCLVGKDKADQVARDMLVSRS